MSGVFVALCIVAVLGVLTVAGILFMSIATVGYVTVQKNAMIDSAKTQIRMFEVAVEMYREDMGKYPSDDQGLQALRIQPPDAPANQWRGPYITVEVPVDPWGNSYIYQEIQEQNGKPSFEIFSCGPDGANGTNDDVLLPK
jgi:general secretion pathway protein G